MTTAFVEGPVFVGDGRILERAIVLVEGERIVKVAEGNVPIPKGARKIPLAGRMLLPGFIDSHVHLCLDGSADPVTLLMGEPLPLTTLKAARFARQTLMAGVTSVRDLGGKDGIDLIIRDAIRSGLIPGPRILASSRLICMTGGHGWQIGREADGPDEVMKVTREQIKAGADVVKFMATGGVMTPGVEPGSEQFTEEELRVGIQEAHKVGKKTATHAMGTQGILNALRAGIDSIEHGVYLDEETISLMVKRDVPLIPTISALYHIETKGVEAGIPAFAVDKTLRVKPFHLGSVRMAREAGVRVAMGTDAGTPFNGHGENLGELQRLVEVGYSPMEALESGTRIAAQVLGQEKELGTIEEGKLADLIVVEGNPLEDVGLLLKTEAIRLVMQGGKLAKGEQLRTIKQGRSIMKKIRMCVKNLIVVSVLIAALGLYLTPSNARAEIKEINIGIGIDADTLNPQEQTTTLIQNICDLIYDNLFYQTPDAKLEPRLATKYEISMDGLTYTIYLRKGVKFSDGTAFDAKALKLTFDRALNPKMRVPLRFYINMIKEATVIDAYTVQLHLKYPFAPLAATLSSTTCSPISPEAIEKYGEDVRKNPVGAGPYLLKEWVAGDRIVLVRNENYYGKKPSVAKLIFKIVPETATREAMLRSGQIDICYKPLPSDVAALKADPNVTVEMPLDTRTIFMGLNYQKGATKNKLVRQAFNYAVDKKAIVKKILFNTAMPMEGPCSPILFGYHKMAHQYEYNPEKAKELLKKANFDFSRTIKMRTPSGRYLFDKQVSEAIQAYLQTIGVKIELRTYDWPTYVAGLLKPLDKTELEVFLLGWGPGILDADTALYGQFHSSVSPPKGLGAAHYSNPEYDKAIEATRLEQDTEKRLALFKKASEIVWDDCPWIWLHTEKFVIAYSSKIKGLVVTSIEKFYATYITME